MCGITGIVAQRLAYPQSEERLKRMVGSLYHRGPDECGFLFGKQAALGMARLSIIDLNTGSQPIHNEDRSLWTVFNGEIFNYIELREELQKLGHTFYTRTDTEVILHSFEQFGMDFLSHLNGQFAIAIWDVKKRRLLLARDRVGIRPLYYAYRDGRLIFGSEIKSILAEGTVPARIEPQGIADIFTFWVNIPPETSFEGIHELPPGNFLLFENGKITVQPYWHYSFPRDNAFDQRGKQVLAGELRDLLHDAVTLRLRSDVPVAAYLSGGIDSSIISALVKKYHNNELITFSVAFKDAHYDERNYQQLMAKHIGTRHFTIEVDHEDIARSFSDVVWFAEKPMMRTAPAPLYALSSLVREHGIKVVLTGEGADEMFGGYNIFKEDKIRRFWARQPNSVCRPMLLARLYPYILKDEKAINPFWQGFFKKNLQDVDNPFYSHWLRWTNTAHLKMVFAGAVKEHFRFEEQLEKVRRYLLPEMVEWHPLNRAQYLEAALFMNGYLLSSQGDRMMMGHSVEGRFPFLDHRVVEFSSNLPPELKINGLNEKYLLKEAYKDLLPEQVVKRNKQPYRAPIATVFLGAHAPQLIRELLSPEMLKKYGYFNPQAIEKLSVKLQKLGKQASARDEMAIVAAASTQLMHYHFVETFKNHTFKLPERQVKITID